MSEQINSPSKHFEPLPSERPRNQTARDAVRKLIQHDPGRTPRGTSPGHDGADPAAPGRRWRLPRLWAKSVTQRQRGGPATALRDRIGATLRAAFNALWQRVRGYRPTRLHIFLAVFALIMWLRPWLIPSILLLSLLVLVISYLTVGPDRFAELVVAGWQRLHRWRPELAETVRLRYEAASARLDAFLRRLPGGWGERVNVPGVARSETAAMDDAPDPFERLAEEAREDHRT